MSKGVFVTGMGIFTSLGRGIDPTLRALKSLTSGLGPISILETIHRDFPVAEIRLSDTGLHALAELNPEKALTRTALMAYIAAKDALESAGMKRGDNLRLGFISATTVGGMDKKEVFYPDAATNAEWLKYIDKQDVAEHTEQVADLLGFHEFVTTVSTACSSGANALMLGARMIRAGLLDRVVAGGSECLTRFHLNGFNSLMILSKEHGKPFDKFRSGINLGEGAGYLVLESEDIVRREGKTPVCAFTGYGNSCEAFHPTASSPDGIGAYLAMQKALETAGLTPADIGYINAHGTGTDSNDVSEGIAIQRLFASGVPPVSSTKPYTGHTTSAAGSVESIISILALNHGIAFPNLNWEHQMDELTFQPVTEVKSLEMQHVLTNSFGFGGNNTSLIFSKI
jgi:3-oxoacyl-[acyl-carrier-protein] synthase II